MAIRRRAITPDTYIETETYGRIPCVSDQAFYEAVMAGASMQALAGGVLTVLVDRHPTDLPEESVTVGAVLEWKSRTDARPAREPVTEPPRASVVDALEEEPVVAPEVIDEPTVDPPPPSPLDGLDRSKLEEEDVSAIPVEAR